MSTWDDIEAEERREWRDSPATKAFFALLRETADNFRQMSVDALRGEAIHQATLHAGQEDGMRRAIYLGERTK